MGLFCQHFKLAFIVNVSLFLLLTFICSLCLHLFVYIYARLLCLPFELAEGSSPLREMRVKSKRAASSQSYGKLFSVRSCCRM